MWESIFLLKACFLRSLSLILLMGLTACTYTIDESALSGPQVGQFGVKNGSEKYGLALGKGLDGEDDFTYEVNVNGRKAIWHFAKETIKPVTVEWEDVPTSYGAMQTVLIAAKQQSGLQSNRPLIVHCYGNGSNLYNTATLNAMIAMPFGDMLQFEYPGFDASADSANLITIENFNSMISAMATHLNAQNIQRPLIFWGHSLGGPVCAQLASKVQQADGLVLEATAADAKSIGQSQIPFLLKPFIRLKVEDDFAQYSVPRVLASFDGKILVLGGRRDKILKVELSRQMAAMLENNARDVQYYEFKEANHFSISAQDNFGDILTGFLTEISSKNQVLRGLDHSKVAR